MKKTLLCFLVLFLLSACSSRPQSSAGSSETPPQQLQESTPDTTPDKYKTIAKEKYQDKVQYLYNKSRSHVVCLKITRTGYAQATYQNQVSFFLYDIENERVIFEDVLDNADVRWLSNDQLRVSITPGIVKGREEENEALYGYVYDVKLQKKLINPGQNSPDAN